MPRILVTNDDGGRSEGIHALAEAVRRLGEVIVVAPNVEASAIGHALTLRRPLRMEQLGEGLYEVDGTPTDCVNIALTQLFDGHIDLVVSGINKGYNIGDDITYSGTVAGAMEAALLGIPGIAVSLERTLGVYDFAASAAAAATVAEAVLRSGITPRTFLNLNVPPGQPKGLRVTFQAKRNHVTVVNPRQDPRGRRVLLDRGRGERVGAARPLGLPGGQGRLRLSDAAPARPHRAFEHRVDRDAARHAIIGTRGRVVDRSAR